MNPIKSDQICLFSLGNSIIGDDGIGFLVLEQLKGRIFNQGIKTIDLGIDPLNVMSYLDDYQNLVFIDAVSKDDKLAKVCKIELEELINAQSSNLISFHSYGILDALKLAKALGYQFRAFLIGINVESLRAGEGISHNLEKELNSIVEKVLAHLSQIEAQVSDDLVGSNNQEEKKHDS